MTDAIPQVALGIDEAAKSVVIIEGAKQVSSLEALLAEAPGLLHPEGALTMARVVNHLATGNDWRVITDPAAYEAAYRARLDTEDPNAPWQQGVLRLRDHGVPDFAAITAPRMAGTRLIFFAADSALGLPYRIEADMADPAHAADRGLYRAVSLTPLPPSTAAPPANPLFVGATGTPVMPAEDDGTEAVPDATQKK